MTFLPLVERELRVRARRPGTFWVRGGAAFFGMVAASGFVVLGQLFRAGSGLGGAMFATLAWLALGFCLLEGARNTADCLSEEKRAGTLGFLFLTDLKGHDVVLGKLVAGGLQSFYGLLAALPLLGLPLLLGGVTAGEFWRVNLALLCALAAALACGLWVSSRAWEAGKAWATTLTWLAGWWLGPLLLAKMMGLIAWAWAVLGSTTTWLPAPDFLDLLARLTRVASPLTAFTAAFASTYAGSPAVYWSSLLVSQLGAAWCVWRASRQLPRRWLEAPRTRAAPADALTMPLRLGQVCRGEAARRAAWLEADPVAWLVLRGEKAAAGIWLLAVGALAMNLLTVLLAGGGWMQPNVLVVPFEFALKVWLAFRTCQMLSEARQSGALELLLVTPVGSKEILRGQLRALRALFFWPAVVMVASRLAFAVLGLAQNSPPQWAWWIWTMAVLQPVSFGVSLLATVFVGLRLTLALKKPGQAAGLTLLLVLVAPAFLICVPNLLIHAGLILWARHGLLRNLRRAATPTGP